MEDIDILNIITHPLVITWVGAVFAQMLSICSPKFKGILPFVKKLIPGKSGSFYFRLNFVFVPLIGALIAFILMEPDSTRDALLSGLSWTGTITALLQQDLSKTANQE